MAGLHCVWWGLGREGGEGGECRIGRVGECVWWGSVCCGGRCDGRSVEKGGKEKP